MRFLIFMAMLVLTGGCATLPASNETRLADLRLPPLPEPGRVAGGQLLLVVGEGRGSQRARLYALEQAGGEWRLHGGPIAAAVGRNGIAAPGEKVEGDGKTPSGIFPLEFVFGYDPAVATKMPYRQATAEDLWVDDPGSPQYNTWVRRGETDAKSYELMRLPDRRYRHGIVIGYNRDPIVKGKGSAIFVHAWLEEGKPTAGCVSLDEDLLVGIIQWLDPERKPHITIGTEADLAEVAAGAGKAAP